MTLTQYLQISGVIYLCWCLLMEESKKTEVPFHELTYEGFMLNFFSFIWVIFAASWCRCNRISSQLGTLGFFKCFLLVFYQSSVYEAITARVKQLDGLGRGASPTVLAAFTSSKSIPGASLQTRFLTAVSISLAGKLIPCLCSMAQGHLGTVSITEDSRIRLQT